MATTVSVLGIRHHGPGSARMLVRALETLRPDAVLIEGPPDAADVVGLAGHEQMKPPVALLVYEPDRPSESACYPFAAFSPEWQAIRWGLANGAEVRFIDLPFALRAPREEALDEKWEGQPTPNASAGDALDEGLVTRGEDPLEALARAAGFSDGEAWWGRLIEERRGEQHGLDVFDAIREAMASARSELGPSGRDPDEPSREAHMRKCIRGAMKEGFERIAVVCGAWHAPELTAEAIKGVTSKADDELLKGLRKRKVAATWIPWTHDRLSIASGYGAGIMSPGWYEHLWTHHERLTENWMARVARLMRDQDLDASPASVIESVRLAETLASMRGRSIAGLEELGEATLAILCHGNPLPMLVIERRLIVGDRLGEVPGDAPTVPLQRDLAAQQRSLRMKVSADETELDLDQRKETDLARSRLLHRLAILRIEWGRLVEDQRQRTSTFHEVWRLQWKPELAVSVLEAARWGNTVQEAAGACVADRARSATALASLTAMLDHVMLTDLPSAVEGLVRRIQEVSAVSGDLGHLMDAIPPLARVLRYGNVRRTDAALVEPVVVGLLVRIRAGLAPACGALDDDGAEAMRARIDAVNVCVAGLDRPDLADPWRDELRKVGDAEVHGLVGGRAWRILLDSGAVGADDAATRLSLALSRGNDPAAASAWLEGFLGGSGMVLIHDERLLAIVDRWVSSLSRETFERVCPIARRTFSTFAKPERRQIGEKLKRAGGPKSEDPVGAGEAFDAERAALVEPVLRLILGDPLP